MDEPLPIVTAAVICERVLTEKDDVVSAIRIFDRLFYVPLPPGIDPGLGRIQFVFLVMLKRGDAPSRRHDITVVVESPSGKEARAMGEPAISIEFPGEDPDAGVNLQVGVALLPAEEGLHWVEMSIDGHLSSRTPFRLTRQETPSQGKELA